MSESIVRLESLWASLPPIVMSLLVLGIGWAFGWLAGKIVGAVCRVVHLDGLCRKLGLQGLLRKAGIEDAPSRLAGAAACWIVVILAMLETSQILDEDLVCELSDDSGNALPAIAADLLVALIGYLLAAVVIYRRIHAADGAAREASNGAKAIPQGRSHVLVVGSDAGPIAESPRVDMAEDSRTEARASREAELRAIPTHEGVH